MENIKKYLLEISKLEAEISQSADIIKKEQERKRELQKKYDIVKLALEAHVSMNKAELLGNARSAKTEYGDFGYKKVEKIEMKKGESNDSVIVALKKKYKARWTDFVEIKEAIKKTALRALTDKQLDCVGLSRKTESFWVKAK